ncbi:MAG: DUF378 domain-containing protein [Natrialbaceae archaeon]|nr:DUF378 domain-containing protein [Natrialbaceae archaeon]
MEINNQIRLNAAEWIALALVIVGAINWGLVGLAEFAGTNLNLVDLLFGAVPSVEAIVYLLVGLAGIYLLYFGYRFWEARTPVDRGRRETTEV